MFDRKMFKEYAKQELRISYGISLLVCVLGGLLGASVASNLLGSISTFSFNFNLFNGDAFGYYPRSYSYSYHGYSGYYYDWYSYFIWFMAIFLVIMFFVLIFSLLWSLFLGGPASVGVANYFLKAPYGERNVGMLLAPFKNGMYWHNCATMFKYRIVLILWALIPFAGPFLAIIKSYEFMLVPYLVAENPNLTSKQARDLSSQMTYGHKMDLFVMSLSFIGWTLLGTMLCGVGAALVAPYIEASFAQAYRFLCWEHNQRIGGQFGSTPPQGGQPYGAPQAPYGHGGQPYNTQNAWGQPAGGYTAPAQQPYGQPVQPYGAQPYSGYPQNGVPSQTPPPAGTYPPAQPAAPYVPPQAPAQPYGQPVPPQQGYAQPQAPASQPVYTPPAAPQGYEPAVPPAPTMPEAPPMPDLSFPGMGDMQPPAAPEPPPIDGDPGSQG